MIHCLLILGIHTYHIYMHTNTHTMQNLPSNCSAFATRWLTSQILPEHHKSCLNITNHVLNNLAVRCWYEAYSFKISIINSISPCLLLLMCYDANISVSNWRLIMWWQAGWTKWYVDIAACCIAWSGLSDCSVEVERHICDQYPDFSWW